MLIVSSAIGSRPLCVILTARRFVFICGETDVIVPWRIVPVLCQKEYVSSPFSVPFFSSIVTVSFAHFIRNLQSPPSQRRRMAWP